MTPKDLFKIIEARELRKPTNPKDAVGVLKAAMSYVSCPVLMELGIAMMEGGMKYGRHNYRTVGVRASVYFDATMRHLMAWWEGEDFDPDITDEHGVSLQVSHITKAIASLTVLRDSMIRGNLNDDRPPKVAPGWVASLNRKVEELAKKYPNPKPPHTNNTTEREYDPAVAPCDDAEFGMKP